MGNFEKLSVVVIVVIIVMILAVAVVEWTSSPSDSPTTDPTTEKAEAPAVVVPDAGPEKAKGEKAKPKPAANKPSPMPFDLDLPKDAKDPWEQWRLGGDDAGKAKPDGKSPEEKKDGTPPTPTPTPVTPPSTTDIPESTYVVAEGDSLSLIAQKVWKKASLWPLIAEANPSVRPESMRKGETLKIPARKNVSAAPAGATPTGGGTKPTPGKEYTVQANDTWERISLAAYNTAARWPEIYVRNVDKVDMKSLRGGIVIMIPK